MQFNRSACVYTFDRHLVGHVTHIVIDPGTKLVTHVVVRQGRFFLEDKVIPIHMFESSCSDGVILREGIGDLHNLPNFEEPYYAIADRHNDLETAKIGSMLAEPTWHCQGALFDWIVMQKVNHTSEAQNKISQQGRLR